jgi:hypothetical protein
MATCFSTRYHPQVIFDVMPIRIESETALRSLKKGGGEEALKMLERYNLYKNKKTYGNILNYIYVK